MNVECFVVNERNIVWETGENSCNQDHRLGVDNRLYNCDLDYLTKTKRIQLAFRIKAEGRGESTAEHFKTDHLDLVRKMEGAFFSLQIRRFKLKVNVLESKLEREQTTKARL